MYCVDKFQLIFVFWNLLSFTNGLSISGAQHNPKIAVVGAGLGGTSCAYFLNEVFEGEVEIDVYEANKIGGRLLSEEVDGSSYEAGGTIIHPKNRYMKNFVRKFGLTSKESFFKGVTGLYDGKEFKFVESKSWYINFIKMMWRYGLELFKINRYITNMLENFDEIYHQQNNAQSFGSVRDMLNAMNLKFPVYLTNTVKDGLKREKNLSGKLVDELVYATIRVNYGQNNSVHQFVGSVSFAGAMDGLWYVEGGNYQVAEKLLLSSGAEFVNKRVDAIKLLRNNTRPFIVMTDDTADEYDAVVIATPLTSDMRTPIQFYDFPSDIYVPGSYHNTICTLVSGTINHKFFGYSNVDELPASIITTEDSLFYNSITLLNSNGENSVYKVFSGKVLTKEQLILLFTKLQSVKVINWLAYPEYSTEPRNDTFVLYKRLYYVNSIEWAASAMEMSIIGGKNVALLVHNDFAQVDFDRPQGFFIPVKKSPYIRGEL